MLGHGAQRPRGEVWMTYSEELGFVGSKMTSSAIDKHLRMLCSSSTGASAICVDREELR
jgi:hypothetical protein